MTRDGVFNFEICGNTAVPKSRLLSCAWQLAQTELCRAEASSPGLPGSLMVTEQSSELASTAGRQQRLIKVKYKGQSRWCNIRSHVGNIVPPGFISQEAGLIAFI